MMVFASFSVRRFLRGAGVVVALAALPAQAIVLDTADQAPLDVAIAPPGAAALAVPGPGPASLDLEPDGPSPDAGATCRGVRGLGAATGPVPPPRVAPCPWRVRAELARAGRCAAPPTGPPLSTI